MKNKQDRIFIVGITGRSGSGKTTVGAHYRKLGYPVADGDAITREIYLPGSECLVQLAAAFGSDILHPDGSLNRKLLGERAFATKALNQTLVGITHPHILQRFLELAGDAHRAGAPLFFLDGAMIVGGPTQPYCNRILLVISNETESIRRIQARDGISLAAVQKRLAAQPPPQALLAAADYVIENNSDLHTLLSRADETLQVLLAEADGNTIDRE